MTLKRYLKEMQKKNEFKLEVVSQASACIVCMCKCMCTALKEEPPNVKYIYI